ncbi:MAG TPA: hypothetical protein VFU49_15390 [Ktedonobacteraceae bacterium]|nr:hypothetical protein [Ktedonobacteraceae bacterium]
MNLYSYEKVCEQRRQELQHEMEEARLGMSAQQHQANPNLGRRIIGNVGKSLVSLGTKLERVDPRNELMPLAESGGRPSLSGSGERYY